MNSAVDLPLSDEMKISAAVDPVCGMTVDPDAAAERSGYRRHRGPEMKSVGTLAVLCVGDVGFDPVREVASHWDVSINGAEPGAGIAHFITQPSRSLPKTFRSSPVPKRW